LYSSIQVQNNKAKSVAMRNQIESQVRKDLEKDIKERIDKEVREKIEKEKVDLSKRLKAKLENEYKVKLKKLCTIENINKRLENTQVMMKEEIKKLKELRKQDRSEVPLFILSQQFEPVLFTRNNNNN
ncbi:unnamed protein product, partial [Meganyctiphanes norvegica]